ncbi:hypothetical protein ACJDT4_19230 [Clostridium neuense]|uniref:Na+/glutamate symporter n=1 Tax=Clostridium neuense TaxID=1728934 RepID=A0ABW8TJ03_9CLOT
MNFSSPECFLIVIAFLLIGEIISNKTKAYIPSVFVTAALFVVGYWTFVPKDVVTRASFGKEFVPICMGLLLTHLGTLMDLRKLIAQWRSVVIALCGVCGTILLTMTVGRLLFDWHTVVAATPPLSGGLVAALLMSEGLKHQGITALVALPIAMFVMHSFFGYPLTSFCLKREGKRLVEDFRKNKVTSKSNREEVSSQIAATTTVRKKLLPPLPEKYETAPMILAKLTIVSLLAGWVSNLTHGAINQYIVCLIFGVIFCELGFLEESALIKAGVFNWLIAGLLVYVFSGLSTITPAQLIKILIPIIVLILLGILGMFLTSLITGKLVGFSKEMSFACALTALFGFPADYIITTEVCKSVSKNEEEEAYVTDILLPRMLVGGFATVSVASVIIAGVFLKML